MIKMVNKYLIVFLVFAASISYGEEYGFARVKNIAVDKNGDVYVLGSVKERRGILKIKPNGHLLRILAEPLFHLRYDPKTKGFYFNETLGFIDIEVDKKGEVTIDGPNPTGIIQAGIIGKKNELISRAFNRQKKYFRLAKLRRESENIWAYIRANEVKRFDGPVVKYENDDLLNLEEGQWVISKRTLEGNMEVLEIKEKLETFQEGDVKARMTKGRLGEVLSFFRVKRIADIENKLIDPASASVAINNKGQLCVLGWGTGKAILPSISVGKIQKRGNGEIITDQLYERRMAILDPKDGHPVVVFGKTGTNEGELYAPTDIAVDSKDNIYIVDRVRDKIIKFSSNGKFIKEWGKWGSGNGEFEGLHGIAIDKRSDTVYTTQGGIGSSADPYVVFQVKVQKFDAEGKFLGKWGGSRITGIGLYWFAPAPIRKYDLDDPRSIAVGPDGSVWLIEVHKPCISKFTPDGKLLLRFGEEGDINGDPRGEIGWYSEGIAVGPDGIVYVCDNGRTSKYSKLVDEKIKNKKGEKMPEPEARIVKFSGEGRYLGEIK